MTTTPCSSLLCDLRGGCSGCVTSVCWWEAAAVADLKRVGPVVVGRNWQLGGNVGRGWSGREDGARVVVSDRIRRCEGIPDYIGSLDK